MGEYEDNEGDTSRVLPSLVQHYEVFQDHHGRARDHDVVPNNVCGHGQMFYNSDIRCDSDNDLDRRNEQLGRNGRQL